MDETIAQKLSEKEKTGDGKLGLRLGQSTIESMKILADMKPDNAYNYAHDVALTGGLIYVLTSPDESMVKSSLECLSSLAQYTRNRDALASHSDMETALGDVISGEHHDVKLRHIARKLRDTLYMSNKLQPLRDMRNTSQVENKDCSKGKPRSSKRRSFFVGVNNSKCRTLVLFIRGMNNRDDLDVCRNQILTVKGVISIEMSFNLRRATIRIKPDLRPALIAQAISKTMTMVAEQVIKEEDGTESYVTFDLDGDAQKDNGEMPDYPAEDSPIKGDNLLCRPGQEEARGWSIFKKGYDILQTAFYW